MMLKNRFQRNTARVKAWLRPPIAEFLIWGAVFFLFRVLVLALSPLSHFYCDEATFTEGALRMAANNLYTGDYWHGPIIYYLLLGVQGLTALFLFLTGRISSVADFIRWYLERPEEVQQLGRFLMSFGGAIMIVLTMYTAHQLSRNRIQARIAGLVLLSMPLFHHASWYVKEDLWAALFGMLAATLAYNRKSFLVVGIFFGLAIAAKYTALLLAPAILIIVISNTGYKLSNWKNWLKQSVYLSGSAIITFILVNPYLVINFNKFLIELQGINAQYLKGADMRNTAAPAYLAGLVFREFLPLDIGITAIIFILGVLILGRRAFIRQHFSLILAPIVVVTLLSLSRAGYARTLTLIIPWLAVLASLILSYTKLSLPRINIGGQIILAALILLQVGGIYRYMTALDTRYLARDYIAQSVPTNATVLLEGVFNDYIDTGPSLLPNLESLKSQHEKLRVLGGAGKLNQIKQSLATANPEGRYNIKSTIDFVAYNEQLDGIDVVILNKWPSIFPEARFYNVREDIGVEMVASYVKGRQSFQELLEKQGFQLVEKFTPGLVAQWSFIDRPDPGVFGISSYLKQGKVTCGPEIIIYSRRSKRIEVSEHQRHLR